MSKVRRPKISRKPLVLVIAVCLLLAGVLIPVGAHLPRWIEVEMVLAAWWLVWMGVLTWLLYQGHTVDDDAGMEFGGTKTETMLDTLSFADAGVGGCGDVSEGCLTLVLSLLAIVLVGLALVFLVEFIIPAIAILLLLSIGGMLARAVNDTHGCEGRFGLSLMWGIVWSTLYIGPVAAIVVWVSTMLVTRPGM